MAKKYRDADVEFMRENIQFAFDRMYDRLNELAMNIRILRRVEELTRNGTMTNEAAYERICDELNSNGNKEMSLEAVRRRYYRMIS